jgi:hypothetical protein
MMLRQTALSLFLILAGCTASNDDPNLPAKVVSPTQGTLSRLDRNYTDGVTTHGLDEALVLITVTDRNSGLTKTGCVYTGGLFGAIEREAGVAFGERNWQAMREKALAKPLRRFVFGSPDALAAVGFRGLDTPDSEACALVRDGWQVRQPDVGQRYTNKPGYRSAHIAGPRS